MANNSLYLVQKKHLGYSIAPINLMWFLCDFVITFMLYMFWADLAANPNSYYQITLFGIPGINIITSFIPVFGIMALWQLSKGFYYE